MQDKGEERWIEGASRGDEGAIHHLLEQHLPALEAFIRLRAARELRDKESCADLAQSVCREVLQQVDDFDYRGDAAFRAWLFLKARSKIQDRLRFYHAQKRDIVRERDEVSIDRATPSRCGESYRFLTPSQVAMDAEDIERFERAFEELPEEYQEVISLARILELPLDQVAEELGKSKGSVRGLLQRGLRRLSWILSRD